MGAPSFRFLRLFRGSLEPEPLLFPALSRSAAQQIIHLLLQWQAVCGGIPCRVVLPQCRAGFGREQVDQLFSVILDGKAIGPGILRPVASPGGQQQTKGLLCRLRIGPSGGASRFACSSAAAYCSYSCVSSCKDRVCSMAIFSWKPSRWPEFPPACRWGWRSASWDIRRRTGRRRYTGNNQ